MVQTFPDPSSLRWSAHTKFNYAVIYIYPSPYHRPESTTTALLRLIGRKLVLLSSALLCLMKDTHTHPPKQLKVPHLVRSARP